MKKQSKKIRTANRQKKNEVRKMVQERIYKNMTDLSYIVGGVNVAMESLLQVLVNKKLITVEEFEKAIQDFGKKVAPLPQTEPERETV